MLRQAQKFVVVGFVSNIVVYFLYVGSNPLGLGHKTAMTIYGLAHVLNLSALLLLVDRFGFPHEIVQGLVIGCLLIWLFLLQKY